MYWYVHSVQIGWPIPLGFARTTQNAERCGNLLGSPPLRSQHHRVIIKVDERFVTDRLEPFPLLLAQRSLGESHCLGRAV